MSVRAMLSGQLACLLCPQWPYVYVLILCCVVGVASGFQCDVCDRDLCPATPGECVGGQTLDGCGCCLVCAHTEGEACEEGAVACDKGLVCMINPRPGALLQGEPHSGVCKPAGG